MKRNKKKITQELNPHYVYQYIFTVLPQRPRCCLRTTNAVQGLLQPHHQEMLELCPQAGKGQEALPKSLKDFSNTDSTF